MLTKKAFCKELGNRISKIRTEKRLTQENIAELAKISTPYYSQIENGNKAMSVFVFYKIAEALQVSPDLLLAGTLNTNDQLQELLQSLTPEQIQAAKGFLDLCRLALSAAEANSEDKHSHS